MTYAIIETGGKQLRVEPGRFYDIELLSAEPDSAVTLETVLLVQHNGDVTIGQPFIDGATVEGTIMRHLRGRKVLVYKMKPKKKTRKKRGHRQEITRLMINSISLNGSVLTSEEAPINETQAAALTPVAQEPDDTAQAPDATLVSEEPDVEPSIPELTPEPADMAQAPDATLVTEEPDAETSTPELTPEPTDTAISDETSAESSTPEDTTQTESE